jgi:hypothetical protein
MVALCLLTIGGSIAYASSHDTISPTFTSKIRQLEVMLKKQSNEEVLAKNKEYIDFIEKNLGTQAARKAEAKLLEPWGNIPPEGKSIMVDIVETSMVK